MNSHVIKGACASGRYVGPAGERRLSDKVTIDQRRAGVRPNISDLSEYARAEPGL